jgi:hypothetical protein
MPSASSQQYPDGEGKVAAGDVGPAQANQWHGSKIGVTLSRSVAVDRPEMSPASGAAAEARIPVRIGAGLNNVRHG